MNDLIEFRFNLVQVYETTHLSVEFIDKSIEHGIIAPSGNGPEEWLFDSNQLNLLKKAARLRNDLRLDWNGLALAIDLIEEVEQLRLENLAMKNRLKRFFQN